MQPTPIAVLFNFLPDSWFVVFSGSSVQVRNQDGTVASWEHGPNGRFAEFRVDGDTLVFSYSPDGLTWTVDSTLPLPYVFSNFRLEVYGQTWTTGANPASAALGSFELCQD